MMKRLSTFVLSVALCLAAQGQEPHVQLSQLEEFLNKQGFNFVHFQSSRDFGIRHLLYLTFHAGSPILKFPEGLSEKDRQRAIHKYDSIYAHDHQVMAEAIDSIRLTFARVSKDAAESYLYECHKNEADTIKYSLALAKTEDAPGSMSDDTASPAARAILTSGYVSGRYYENAREIVDFDYQRKRTYDDERVGNWESGTLTHVYFDKTNISADAMKTFDTMAFERLIQPTLKRAMKLKGAKKHPIYWQHDKGFEDKVGGNGGLFWKGGVRYSVGEENHAGLTTGTDYFIPFQHKDAALAMLQELDSLAHGYVDAHPEQYYNYDSPDLPRLSLNLIRIVSGGDRRGENHYELRFCRDADGYHVLYITTKGELWVPRDWQKLKSYINGKKVYRKE